ncbi:GPO family capsid scaffolding protein [Escherichia coli]|nr:GPO family capsid scaffolding protein [Escherichia coli]
MAKKVSKFFRIGVEGDTCDGRVISAQDIQEMAETFDPRVYGCRINLEHLRGILPDGIFKRYGDVVELKAEKIDDDSALKGKWALFAKITPTDDLIAMNKAAQKVYTSMEIQPNFANTGKCYLVGLAVTDDPASLGTEYLEFCRTAKHNPLNRFKLSPENLISVATPVELEFEDLPETPKAVKSAYDNAEKRLQKDQNGADIPGKDTFTKNIGACRAYSGALSTEAGNWTTAQFIEWLDSRGAFNHPYWMCKGSWSYANNKIITDTGCGDINLAGCVVEVMGTKSAITIRVTTPTTSSGGGTTSAQFTYINHGDGYSPGWRRDWNRQGDAMTGTINQDGGSQNAYMSTALCSGTRGGKKYLRKFRGGEGDTIWHETVQGEVIRWATGNYDAREELSLSSAYGLRSRGVITSLSANGLRIAYGNYGFFIRNDGGSTYLMLTASGDKFGTWNGLRPLTINNANGGVSMGHGLSVTGDIASSTKVRAGSGKKFTVSSSNTSTKEAAFNLWGNSSRPVVAELGDDAGWHFYSQRNTDNSITFAVNGQVSPSNYSNFDSRYVRDIRLGTRVVQTMQKGVMYEKAGHVITGLGIVGEVDGDDPAVFRPIQKYINGTWYNVAQV